VTTSVKLIAGIFLANGGMEEIAQRGAK